MITATETLRYLNIQIGSWVTATKYKVGQYISEGGVIYECIIEHTSAATFAADLSAFKWTADTFVLQCMNQAISDVNTMSNRDFRYASYTDKFQGDGYAVHWVNNPPVSAITSIKYFDEDTATYLTIFSGSDTVSNSAQILGGKLRLFNGYSFESSKQYEVVYTGGYGTVPEDVKGTTKEIAGLHIKQSATANGGLALLGLTSRNMAGQGTESAGFNFEQAVTNALKQVEMYKIQNV